MTFVADIGLLGEGALAEPETPVYVLLRLPLGLMYAQDAMTPTPLQTYVEGDVFVIRWVLTQRQAQAGSSVRVIGRAIAVGGHTHTGTLSVISAGLPGAGDQRQVSTRVFGIYLPILQR